MLSNKYDELIEALETNEDPELDLYLRKAAANTIRHLVNVAEGIDCAEVEWQTGNPKEEGSYYVIARALKDDSRCYPAKKGQTTLFTDIWFRDELGWYECGKEFGRWEVICWYPRVEVSVELPKEPEVDYAFCLGLN